MAIRKTQQKKVEQKNIKEVDPVEETPEKEEIETAEEEEQTASEQSSSEGDSESGYGSDEGSEESDSEEEQSSSEESEKKESELPKEERTIFIKGISYNATNEDLEEIFGKYGNIQEIRIPRNREGGKGKGFAYIEFDTKEACDKSLAVSGTECEGRKLVIDFAKTGPRADEGMGREREQREPREREPRYNNDSGITVFLGNVPFEFDKDEFFEYLKGFAGVKDLRVPTDRDTGRPKGFAFASFDSQSEADRLINSELVFHDRTIRAQISEQRRGGSAPAPRRDGGNFGKRSWSSENNNNKKHVKFE